MSPPYHPWGSRSETHRPNQMPSPRGPTLQPFTEALWDPLPVPNALPQRDYGPPDDGSEIDVHGGVYTLAAKHREGGRAAIEALIELFVAETNQAYMRTAEVIHRIRLVWKGRGGLPRGRRNAGIDLARLSRIAFDEYMNHIHESARSLRGRPRPYCGRQNRQKRFVWPWSIRWDISTSPTGFALTAHYCVDLTFAHELGHNFGLSHDRYAFSREYPEIELGSEGELRLCEPANV